MEQTNVVPREHGEQVRSLAETGVSDDDIAAKLKLSRKRLRKLYWRELRQGRAEGNCKVLGNLYQAASSSSNLTAATLWARARCEWGDTAAAAAPATTRYIRSKLIVGLVNTPQHNVTTPEPAPESV